MRHEVDVMRWEKGRDGLCISILHVWGVFVACSLCAFTNSLIPSGLEF